jgi:phenol 2-monooxygenase
VRDASRLAALRTLAAALDGPTSPVRLFTPKEAPSDSVVETLTIFATPHRDIQLLQASLPDVLVPKRKYGVRAFDTLFVDEPSFHDGDGRAYEGYGIGAEGCVVVVRPDQHVAGVFGLEAYEEVKGFFEGFMVPQV